MDTFISELEKLGDEYERTLKNIKSDRHGGTSPPHRNIKQETQLLIEEDCKYHTSLDKDALKEIAEKYYSFNISGKTAFDHNSTDKLYMAVNISTFIDYHMCKERIPKYYQYADICEAKKEIDDYLTSPDRNPKILKYLLEGKCQRTMAWWTFDMKSVISPIEVSGEQLVHELALPYLTIESAKTKKGVVLIEIETAALPDDIKCYKPSSLDGYGPGSRFKPDLSSAPHGWTDPDLNLYPAYQKRPEIISKPFFYKTCKPITTLVGPVAGIQVRVLTW